MCYFYHILWLSQVYPQPLVVVMLDVVAREALEYISA